MDFSYRMLVVFGVSGLAASICHGQSTLYSNLNAEIGNYYPIAGGDQPVAGPLANSFSTGSTSRMLTDVDVYLERMAAPFNSFTVAIYSSSGNSPSTEIRILGTLNDEAISTDGGVYHFPVSPAVLLTANTRYFTVLYPNNTGSEATSTYWATADGTAGAGKIRSEYNCFEGFFGEKRSSNVRIGFRPHAEPSSGCFLNSSIHDPFLMSVTAAPASAPVAATAIRLPVSAAALTVLAAFSAVLLLHRSILQKA